MFADETFMKFLMIILSSQIAFAGLNLNDMRGTEIKRYISPNGATEICVIPAHLAGAAYSESDLKREKKICDFNFYKDSSVLCPKYNSTSAAVIAYSTQSATAKKDLQNAKQCIALDGDKVTTVSVEKIGKFKQNEPFNETTTTNISSPLAYYHVSRALGHILNIPIAVIRTMDIKGHQEVNGIFNELSKLTKVSAGTKAGWKAFANLHQGKHDEFSVYTSDQGQIYGAIVKGGGTIKAYDIEEESLIAKTAFYKAQQSSNSILKILNGANESAKRELVLQTGDMADMVVIDTLLEQIDRYSGSNIETYNIFWNGQTYLSQKDVEGLSVEEVQKMKKIKRLSIQDTDAGMMSSQNLRNWERVEKLRHISPSTYKGVLALARIPDLKLFMQRETLMSDKESSRFVASVIKMSQKLEKDCRSGRLLVDLDVDAVLSNLATPSFSKSQCP